MKTWELIILIILVAIIAYTFVCLLASFISRGTIYGDNENRTRMEECLAEDVSYQNCYKAIYRTAAFE